MFVHLARVRTGMVTLQTLPYLRRNLKFKLSIFYPVILGTVITLLGTVITLLGTVITLLSDPPCKDSNV